MKRQRILCILFIIALCSLNSCKKYLDVIPDNVATLDNAFANRTEAQKYLFTCYSYLPRNSDFNDDPGMFGGDEIWEPANSTGYIQMARGFQSIVSPLGDRWSRLFNGIRDCNIFLDNIQRVPDIVETERRRWRSEVLFLKAYYNFYLIKMYGPIPLMKKNIPIDADESEIRVYRAPLDSCFSYVIQLLDAAEENLPLTILNPQDELGRITKPVNRALKAKVLVYAASPLFNGNTDESTLKGKDGKLLFSQTVSKAKWEAAALACKEAIDICHDAGNTLYYYERSFQQYDLSDTIITQLNIRNSICEEWNSELIWGNTQVDTRELQRRASTFWDPATLDQVATEGLLAPPLKIAEMFYSEHGVPITEDKTWNYNSRYSLQTAGEGDELYVRKGYITAHMNFSREPRYYADLGFDGGIWHGQGRYDDNNPMDLFYLQCLYKQPSGVAKFGVGSVTGYYVKKLVNYENVVSPSGSYSAPAYPFPIIRLAGLFLLYSESLNEAKGPIPEVFSYIDSVRLRAGIPTVKEAWSKYSTNPSSYMSQNGMRNIIQRERLIELAFEGQRFWDLRRWKKSATELSKPILSWDVKQETSAAYYRPVTVYNQKFSVRDYFWPIDEHTLERNPNLVQNIGW